MCRPDDIYWCDGSQEENDGCSAKWSSGMAPLNSEAAGCHLFSHPRTSRVEDGLYRPRKEDAITNNWIDPVELKKTMTELYTGARKDDVRHALSMGPVGSPMSKIGVQITDSPLSSSTCAS